MPELMEAGFRTCLLRSFLGRMVSLLGFMRRLPLASDHGWLILSACVMVACGMEGMVSVSTVMFLEPTSAFDFPGGRRGMESFRDKLLWWCRERLPSLLLPPLSLPLSVALLFWLRSSETFAVLLSEGSLSEDLLVKELWVILVALLVRVENVIAMEKDFSLREREEGVDNQQEPT